MHLEFGGLRLYNTRFYLFDAWFHRRNVRASERHGLEDTEACDFYMYHHHHHATCTVEDQEDRLTRNRIWDI